jgi:ribose-phosphate pyrophosphokinase
MTDEHLSITPEQEVFDDRLYDSFLADLAAQEARAKERPPTTPTLSWYEHMDRSNPLSQVLILSGSSHPEFAAQVAQHLGFEKTGEEPANFSDDSVRVRIGSNMRDRKTLFIGSPHGKETGNHFDELTFAATTARNHWATYQGLLAVVPYFVYGRQDRESYGQREPPSAHIMIQRFRDEGVLGMMTMDPHNDAVTGSFRGPWERLYGSYYLSKHIRRVLPDLNPVVVNPDAGAGKRSRHFADYLGNVPMVSADKFRIESGEATGEIEFGNYIKGVKGADCIIPDDEISSGETIDGVAKTLRMLGANSVIAVATHGKFAKSGRARLYKSKNVDLVFVTDTLPQNEEILKATGMDEKIKVVHVAGVSGR